MIYLSNFKTLYWVFLIFYCLGFRITAEEKIASMMHRSRAATRWGTEDYSGSLSVHPQFPDETESNEDGNNAAASLIDIYRLEAAADDPLTPSQLKQLQYLQDTQNALRQITTGQSYSNRKYV